MPTVPIQQLFQSAIHHHQSGRLSEAQALYRQILQLQPNHPEALHLLGVTAYQCGQANVATDLIRRAIALDPNNAAAHSNLGEIYRTLGRREEATEALRKALQLNARNAEALNNLSIVLRESGQVAEAIALSRRALECRPVFPDAYNNLGAALADAGRFEEAIRAYGTALQQKPDFIVVYFNLGLACREAGRPDEAIEAFRRASACEPNRSETKIHLGNALKDVGRLDDAITAYRQAVEISPESPNYHSNLIYTLHFHPTVPTEAILKEQALWNQKLSDSLKTSHFIHTNDPAPDRRLRVGYISPNFCRHVIGQNLVPLLRFHDRSEIEIVCYSDVTKADELTGQMRERAALWRNTIGATDAAVVEMIRKDNIDILVDLSQHTAGNRLPVFAQDPAPVQVSFAGYPDTTGLKALPYRISDRYLENHTITDEHLQRGVSATFGCPSMFSDFRFKNAKDEQIFCLESFWCYDPCGTDVAVNPLPAASSGAITFGSLNNFCKTNELTMKFWARILRELPISRLILLSPHGSHRQCVLSLFERKGVDGSRLEFISTLPRRAYLELYHRLDIVLDTFPYNGHTTSLDALWMGVPVVSLCGERPVSRAGLSQLTNLGLSELVADSADAYVSIATELANDGARLSELRATLRTRMENSVLMDGPRFARQIEAAYRAMWRDWCGKQKS